MPKLGRLKVIRVSAEAAETKGLAVPGTTEMLVYDPTINPEDNMIQREPAIGFGGPYKAERGPSVGTVTFRVELRSNGTSTLDVGLLICLQGCGMKLTSGTLAPVTLVSDQKTITLDVWSDGLHERLYGAAGTFEMAGEWGKQVFLEFTFTGIYTKLADAVVPTTSHTAFAPMLAKAATMTLPAAKTPQISRFSINPNNPVEPVEDITAAEGVAYYMIGAGRRYVIGMDPLVEATATLDFRGLWIAKTESAFGLLLSDGLVDVTIAAPKVQFMPPQQADRDSKASYDLSGQCNIGAAGDDELTIAAAAH